MCVQQRQLHLLENLKEQAKQAVLDENVTYKWWVEFNVELAELITEEGSFDIVNVRFVRSVVTESLSGFPLKMMMPTTKGELGIMAFNRAGVEGVYPAGLINQRYVYVDQRKYPPLDFFIHDLTHSSYGGNQILLEYSAGHRLFHKRLLHNMENLPTIEQRKKTEAVYFLMTHEDSGWNMSYSHRTPQQMRESVIKLVETDNPGLFDFSDDAAQKKREIEDMATLFMEVYLQTSNGLH